ISLKIYEWQQILRVREYSANDKEKLEIRENFIANEVTKSLPNTLPSYSDFKFASKLINIQDIKTFSATLKKHPDSMYTNKLINTVEIIQAYSRSIEINKADSTLCQLSVSTLLSNNNDNGNNTLSRKRKLLDINDNNHEFSHKRIILDIDDNYNHALSRKRKITDNN
ncbi:14395_t:CDS:2, partial [Dentiscutata heterogama]